MLSDSGVPGSTSTVTCSKMYELHNDSRHGRADRKVHTNLLHSLGFIYVSTARHGKLKQSEETSKRNTVEHIKGARRERERICNVDMQSRSAI